MYLLAFYDDLQKVTDVFIQLSFEIMTIIKLLIIVRHRNVITKMLQAIQADCDASKNYRSKSGILRFI